MYCKEKEVQSTIKEYLRFNDTDRLTILFYSYRPGNQYANDFPVNLLRNVGIRQITTSHFLMLDMDMWVKGNGLMVV